MLRQFLQAKAECADSLLFFRMGDFYELFLDDALEAAELLGLTLTSRDGEGKGQRVPMCGVPVRAVDGYVAKAIKAGRTVTICDQVEDPKLAKGIVKREVIRTITPGTVMEPDLLEEASNNYLGAVCAGGDGAGLAFVDVSTGEFMAAQIEGDIERVLIDELTRLNPVELLVPEGLESGWLEALRRRFPELTVAERPEEDFGAETAQEHLYELFEINTLKGVGLEDAPEAAACAGALLAYVKETQRGAMPQLQLPRRYSPSGYVVLDGNTQRNLELAESLAEKSKRGTLLGVLDQTRTSMGARETARLDSASFARYRGHRGPAKRGGRILRGGGIAASPAGLAKRRVGSRTASGTHYRKIGQRAGRESARKFAGPRARIARGVGGMRRGHAPVGARRHGRMRRCGGVGPDGGGG